MDLRKISCLWALLCITLAVSAKLELKVTYTDNTGAEITTTENFTADAPLFARMSSNASEEYENASLGWHIRNQKSGTNVTRYEDETTFTFTDAGINAITLVVNQQGEAVDSAYIEVTITESHLEMPNAFSPNDDGYNDIYGAKGVNDPNSSEHYKSIVEFHGYIFNRWGQKLFEWTDITKGWDGTYNGQPVKDGVYFVYVKARGADGVEYNIRKDVNLIRSFNRVETSNE